MRRAVWIAALMIGSVLCAAPSDAWLRLRSANFELFTTSGERGGRDLLKQFERVRSFFQQAFGLIPSDGKPVQIVAFRSAKEFEPYKFNEAASAYFESGQDHDFIVMQSTSPEHYPVAVHEYTHLLIHQMGRIPPWLNEGLAELYSTLEPRDGQVLVGRLVEGRAALLARERWLNLEDVIRVDQNSPLYNEKTQAGMFYAESWFLVHMLALQEWYSPRFRELGMALQENDTAAAFLKVYGKTVQQVEQDLHLYFASPHLTGRLFPVKLAEADEAPAVERGGLRARLALAEVLNSIPNHRDAARQACEELRRDFAGLWETEQRCGEVFWRDRNLAEAARSFGRAVEMGADDPRLYLAYGRILAALGRLPEAVAELRTAVAKSPQWNEGHFELAVTLVQSSSFREALDEFRQVKKLPQEQAVRYYYNLAFAHFRLGDAAGARKLIERATPFAKTDRDREVLEGLRTACCGN